MIASLLYTENPQIMVAIAGGICAIFGATVVAFTGKKNKEKISQVKLPQQFAEDFLTNKKGDRQHRSSMNSSLVRFSGTINSKYWQVVKIIRKWDGKRKT